MKEFSRHVTAQGDRALPRIRSTIDDLDYPNHSRSNSAAAAGKPR